MSHHGLQRGFTLIEMMITLVVAGLLLFLAIPTYTEYLVNSRIRAAAEGISGGLQTARIEAVKRNTPVEFVLTDSAPNSATVTALTTGKNWVIRYSTDSGATYNFVAGWNGSESGSSAISYGATANTITFGGLGATTPTAGATFDIANPTAGSCRTTGGTGNVRCLRVVLSGSGEVRMCDPSIQNSGSNRDTRAC